MGEPPSADPPRPPLLRPPLASSHLPPGAPPPPHRKTAVQEARDAAREAARAASRPRVPTPAKSGEVHVVTAVPVPAAERDAGAPTAAEPPPSTPPARDAAALATDLASGHDAASVPVVERALKAGALLKQGAANRAFKERCVGKRLYAASRRS